MGGFKPVSKKSSSNRNHQPKHYFVNYKTEMCRKWESGGCDFGEKCLFAHGAHELKRKKHVPRNYKTKACKPFFEVGYCLYGQRCQFSHQALPPKGVKPKDDTVTKRTAPCTPVKTRPQEEACERKRLPIFVQLENKAGI